MRCVGLVVLVAGLLVAAGREDHRPVRRLRGPGEPVAGTRLRRSIARSAPSRRFGLILPCASTAGIRICSIRISSASRGDGDDASVRSRSDGRARPAGGGPARGRRSRGHGGRRDRRRRTRCSSRSAPGRSASTSSTRTPLRAAVAGHDAVVNVTTKIPPLAQMAAIRARGTRTSGSAARPRPISSTPRSPRARPCSCRSRSRSSTASTATSGSTRLRRRWPTSTFSGAIEAAEANVARFRARGGRGVVLRFGRFYAPDSDQAVALDARGTARAWCSTSARGGSTTPDDRRRRRRGRGRRRARRAGRHVRHRRRRTVRLAREQTSALAAAVGRRRLCARTDVGRAEEGRATSRASQRVSNRRVPRGDRLATVVAERARGLPQDWSRGTAASSRRCPVGCGSCCGCSPSSAFGVGLQAEFFPRSFYDDFPFGRGWVAMDGRYNEHLIRDFGALNLALLRADARRDLRRARARSARIAAVSWLVYSVPHLVYHLRHLTMVMPGVDKVGIVVSLSLPIVAAIVMLFDRPHGARPRSIDAREPAPSRQT